MNLLDPTYIRDNVDYSFGDQSSMVHNLFDGYMKTANIENVEFVKKINLIKNEKNIITLFIDNIRLYQRNNVKYTAMELNNSINKDYKDKRIEELKNNDLLKLCSELPEFRFIIFTNFEDTPIDDEIFDKIPNNVLGLYVSNAMSFGGKIKPFPLGLQRKLHINDKNQEVLKTLINYNVKPKKLLYINHNNNTNPIRAKITNFFENKNWATIGSKTKSYEEFLLNIKEHKFMICPEGNAIGGDCHRDWEVIYMRRVPIIKKNDFLTNLFDGIPVLFVEDFNDVTESLLNENLNLYDEMQNFDLSNLDIKKMYEKILKEYNL